MGVQWGPRTTHGRVPGQGTDWERGRSAFSSGLACSGLATRASAGHA